MTSSGDGAQGAAIDRELRNMALAVVAGAIMTILDTTIVNIAVDTLGRDFNEPLSVIQWTLTAYMLALSFSIPLTGWLVRRFGARTTWIVSLCTFLAGSVLCGAAWSVPALVVFRVVQGIGGGLLLPVGQTILAQAAGPRRLGRIMSVFSVPAMLAPVLGPALGGLIVANLSWRWIFFVNLPVGVLAIVLALRMLPADGPRGNEERFDLLGLLLLSPGLALLVYGLSEVGSNNGLALGGALLGFVLLAVFLLRARRPAGDGSRKPLIDISVFRDRAFGTNTAALFIYSAAIFGILVILPLYYQSVQERSALVSGMLLGPLGVGAMLTMSRAGKVTDRSGPRPVVTAGLILVVAGALVFTQMTTSTNTGLLVGALFVVGLGHGLITPSLSAGAMQRLDRARLPSASTASNIAARAGTSVGTAVLAVVLQLQIRASLSGSMTLARASASHTPQVKTGLTEAFAHSIWWVVAIAALAVVPVLLIPARRRQVATAT